MTTRRQFVLSTIPATALLIATSHAATARAVTAPAVTAKVARLAEADPLAIALGYKADAKKVDAKKFAGYVPGHRCAGCQLFQGSATEQWGACAAVGGKLVNANGWCAAWAKKA